MKKIIALLLVLLLSLFCVSNITSNTSQSFDPDDIPLVLPPEPNPVP